MGSGSNKERYSVIKSGSETYSSIGLDADRNRNTDLDTEIYRVSQIVAGRIIPAPYLALINNLLSLTNLTALTSPTCMIAALHGSARRLKTLRTFPPLTYSYILFVSR